MKLEMSVELAKLEGRSQLSGMLKHIVKILSGELIASHDPWLCKF